MDGVLRAVPLPVPFTMRRDRDLVPAHLNTIQIWLFQLRCIFGAIPTYNSEQLRLYTIKISDICPIMSHVSIEEFFLRRSGHIEEERALFAKFAKLVAPSETELLSLSWDER